MARKSKFFNFYIAFVISFILLIIIGLSVFYSFLKTYEASQPKSIAQNICDKYVKTADFWGLKENYPIDISDYETKENVNKAFKEYIGGNIELNYSSKTPKGSDVCFVIKADDDNLMSIALKKDKESGSFGITGYKVNEITVLKDIYKSVTISFPSDAKFTVNSKTLRKTDFEKLPLPEIGGVTFDEDVVYSCRATFDNLLSDDLTVKTESDDFDLVRDGNNYYITQRFSEDFTQDIESFAVKGAQTYAAHMQDKLSLSEMRKYFDTSSDFYKNVKNTIVSFALDHDSYFFENVECTELSKHSKDIYSCRVKFTHALKKGARMYRDAFCKRVYIRITDGDKKIIDMQSVE